MVLVLLLATWPSWIDLVLDTVSKQTTSGTGAHAHVKQLKPFPVANPVTGYCLVIICEFMWGSSRGLVVEHMTCDEQIMCSNPVMVIFRVRKIWYHVSWLVTRLGFWNLTWLVKVGLRIESCCKGMNKYTYYRYYSYYYCIYTLLMGSWKFISKQYPVLGLMLDNASK